MARKNSRMMALIDQVRFPDLLRTMPPLRKKCSLHFLIHSICSIVSGVLCRWWCLEGGEEHYCCHCCHEEVFGEGDPGHGDGEDGAEAGAEYFFFFP